MTLVKLETQELTAIDESKAAKIKATFEPMVKMLESFEDLYNEVLTESESGITNELCQRAKRIRLDVGKVRIETGKLKDKQKEYIKLEDKAIMGVHNIIVWAVKEKEDKLKEIEDYFEIQEQKRLEKLQQDRAEKPSKYVENAFELNLYNMEDDVFEAYFSAKKKEHEDRIEAQRKAEEERQKIIRKQQLNGERRELLLPYYQFWSDKLKETNLGELEQYEIDEILKLLKLQKEQYDKEQEKIRIEKQRLEKEAEKKRKEYELKLKIERMEREKIEREKREKLEAELKAKEEAEKKEKQRLLDEKLAKEKAEKAARLAPDKDKLLKFAESIMSLERPELKTIESAQVLSDVENLLLKTVNYIKEKASKL